MGSEATDLIEKLRVLGLQAVVLRFELNKIIFTISMVLFCCVMVSLRFAISCAISSKFVPLSSLPPEISKPGVLLVPVKVAVFFLRLFSPVVTPLVTRLNSESGGEPSCRNENVACWGSKGEPPGSAPAGSAIRPRNVFVLHTRLHKLSIGIQLF